MIAQLLHDPRYPRQGVVRLIRGELQMLWHYGFNMRDEARRYWLGAKANGVFNLRTTIDPHSTFAKTLYPNAELHQEVHSGTASLTQSGEKVIYLANIAELGLLNNTRVRFVQELEVLYQSDHEFNGVWEKPGMTNEGYTVVLLPGVAVVHYFGQKPRPRWGTIEANRVECQTQDWTISAGPFDGQSAFLVENEVRNGRLMFAGEAVPEDEQKARYDPDDPRIQELPTGRVMELEVNGGIFLDGIQLEAIA